MLETYLQHQQHSREAGLILCVDAASCASVLDELTSSGWELATTVNSLVAALIDGKRAAWRLSDELPHQVYELICNLPHGDAPVLHADGTVTREILRDGANLVLVGTYADLTALEAKGLDLRARTGLAFALDAVPTPTPAPLA